MGFKSLKEEGVEMEAPKSPPSMEEMAKKAGAVEVKGKVKWFDAVKGFGFIVPEDREEDILVHFSVLREIGVTTVPEGATLTCLAIEGLKGWQAIRVSAIDLSTATPASELGKRDDDFDPTANLENVSDFMEATVKWFNRLRGYGFRARMLAPMVSKLWAFASPSAPKNTSLVDTSSTSARPELWMASRYSPARRAPPIQAVQRSTSSLASSGTCL